MIPKKDNYQIAISSLTAARNDHYDGVNAIYRLAAQVPINKGTSPDGVQRQIRRLVKDLMVQKVRANRINIHEEVLVIDFYPKGFQMVMNRGQYAGLQLEFAEFLNQTGIWGIEIQDGCYMDDPEDSVKSVSNDLINFFPEFNSKCFGVRDNEPIEIINCCSFELYGEVA
ncbi:hypothetical protein FH490_05610 [Bacillus velezensis]|uniref:hypothetical protein n=1 Tax=Bacillus velezensis TaxID=492670 RepID=UPI0011213CDF|nr:hypothetical protein [Bacillus velezensis]TNU29702.1 hypothetical protein FH490_05610 [Bacillus velezensis]